jgi:hypothetical protein
MSIEVPVVRKNNPSSKPLNGLMSASIWVLKFVSARIAPAKNAPSCNVALHIIVTLVFNIFHNPTVNPKIKPYALKNSEPYH